MRRTLDLCWISWVAVADDVAVRRQLGDAGRLIGKELVIKKDAVSQPDHVVLVDVEVSVGYDRP